MAEEQQRFNANFPSINHFTNKEIKGKYAFCEWQIEEKIDGSQLSFCLDENNKITFFNKGKTFSKHSTVFRNATYALSILENQLNPNYSYHGEAICNVRHNVVTYQRTPRYYFVLFDVREQNTKKYLPIELKEKEAKRLNLEFVQILFHYIPPVNIKTINNNGEENAKNDENKDNNDNNNIVILEDKGEINGENNEEDNNIVGEDNQLNPYEKCKEIIKDIIEGKRESLLGGPKIEGVVFKLHDLKSGTRSTQKMVSPEFKEARGVKKLKNLALTNDEWLSALSERFNREARFRKAVQHLNERNSLTGNPKSDINRLTSELDDDLEKEYKQEIIALLWARFGPIVFEGSRRGFHDWFEATKGSFGVDKLDNPIQPKKKGKGNKNNNANIEKQAEKEENNTETNEEHAE